MRILTGCVWFFHQRKGRSDLSTVDIHSHACRKNVVFFCGCSFLLLRSACSIKAQGGEPLVQTKQNTHTAAANQRRQARDGQLSGQHGPWRGRRVKQTPAPLWSVGNYSDWEQMRILKTQRASEEEDGENASICPMRRVEFIYYQEEEVVPWGGLINVQPSILSVRFCLLKGKQSTGGWERERGVVGGVRLMAATEVSFHVAWARQLWLMAQTMIGRTLSSCSPTMGIMGKKERKWKSERERESAHPIRGQKSTCVANQREMENRARNQATERERTRERNMENEKIERDRMNKRGGDLDEACLISLDYICGCNSRCV